MSRKDLDNLPVKHETDADMAHALMLKSVKIDAPLPKVQSQEQALMYASKQKSKNRWAFKPIGNKLTPVYEQVPDCIRKYADIKLGAKKPLMRYVVRVHKDHEQPNAESKPSGRERLQKKQ